MVLLSFHAELGQNHGRDRKEDELLVLDRGLRYGALMITDEDGRKISLKYAGEKGKGSYYELMSILPGLTESTCGFKRMSPKRSELLGRHLVPGRWYRIGFSEQPTGTLCEVEEKDAEAHERQEAKIKPSWDPRDNPFTVVDGARKPLMNLI